MKIILLIIALLMVPNLSADNFELIDNNGLGWGNFEILNCTDSTKFEINILRIDPDKYEFVLLTASEYGCKPRTMRQWYQKHELCAAFNAGMYAKDLLTSLGYCRNYQHINNSRLNKHNTVLAFNPVNSKNRSVRIIDRKCEDFDKLKSGYHSFLQSIRMLGCNKTNVWKQSDKKYSILALAEDSAGFMLACFCQKPLSAHDFINYMLKLELGLKRMMYLEGGGPANLYIDNNGFTRDLAGCIERFAPAEVINPIRVPVPNVIGIKKK